MSNPAFRRFGNPGFLRKIKSKNLMSLLRRFTPFFESKGISLSAENLSEVQLDQLSAIIVSPPSSCPGEFLAAVDLLEMLTSGPGIDELRVVVPELVQKVHEKGDTNGDIVLKVWFLDSKAIQRIYTKFSLKRNRTMKSFRSAEGQKPVELTRDVCQAIAKELEFGCSDLFGQIPDTLEDVWVKVALHDEQAARQLIDRTTATRNPFDVKYSKVEDADWETCTSVLNKVSMKELLSKGW